MSISRRRSTAWRLASAVAGQLITADYFNEYGALGPGENVELRFQAVIDPNLVPGDTITNTGRVYWDDPQQQAEASRCLSTLARCRTPAC